MPPSKRLLEILYTLQEQTGGDLRDLAYKLEQDPLQELPFDVNSFAHAIDALVIFYTRETLKDASVWDTYYMLQRLQKALATRGRTNNHIC